MLLQQGLCKLPQTTACEDGQGSKIKVWACSDTLTGYTTLAVGIMPESRNTARSSMIAYNQKNMTISLRPAYDLWYRSEYRGSHPQRGQISPTAVYLLRI